MSSSSSFTRRAAVIVVVVAVTSLMTGVGQAEPPDPGPGPTKPTAEQNLDGNGLIRVHEQGVADTNITNENLDVTLQNSLLDVNVTNDSLPVEGDVSVSNFPATQNVSVQNFPANQSVSVSNFPSTQTVTLGGGMPAVTRAFGLHFAPESDFGSETKIFPVINATTIIVAKGDDEVGVDLLSPLFGSDRQFGLTWDTEGSDSTQIFNFTYPIPVNGIEVVCMNESERCNMLVSIAGF